MGENPSDLADQVSRFLSGVGCNGWIIDLERLSVKVAKTGDKAWECNSCKRVHWHQSSGICTRCFAELDDESLNRTASEIRNWHYYASEALNTIPSRLHCEELTGQTENQAQRQRHFRKTLPRGREN